MEKHIIYPKVVVYKNTLPNAKKYVDLLKFSESQNAKYNFIEWENWYGFGKFMNIGMPDKEDLLNANTVDEYELNQVEFINDITTIFHKVTEDYIKEYNIQLPNWVCGGLSICKYDETAGHNEYAMHYHTDYRTGDEEKPGDKFAITCTIYLNDDYEGGGLKFLRDDNGDVVDYKPEAGDIVVFPSGDPLTGTSHYYHAVDKISKNNKYFIRCFWMYHYEGSEQWHKNVEKYGKETWEKMHDEKMLKDNRDGKFHKYVVTPGVNSPVYDHSQPFYKVENNGD